VTPEIKTQVPSLILRLLMEDDAEELALRVDQTSEEELRGQNSILDQHERRFSMRDCRVVGRDGKIQRTANGCTPAP